MSAERLLLPRGRGLVLCRVEPVVLLLAHSPVSVIDAVGWFASRGRAACQRRALFLLARCARAFRDQEAALTVVSCRGDFVLVGCVGLIDATARC